MRKKIIFMFILFIFPMSVFGFKYGGCDYSVVSRMQSITTNINVSYDYRIENGIAYFDVTLNNLTPDVYFYDSINKREYHYRDTNNGEITLRNYTNYGYTGVYKFYSDVSECHGISVGTKYFKLPYYNPYHNDELCIGIENYSLCQKWTKINYSYDEFKAKIEEYNQREPEESKKTNKVVYEKGVIDYIVSFYIKYYYVILLFIIIVFSLIIFMKRRKDKFKL